MPRNSAGTYSLPNPPVVTDTTIDSADENDTRDDIADELTNSLDRNGRGAMLAPLQLANGTVGAPALTFATDPDCGMYRIGANSYGFSVAGVLTMTLAALAVTLAATLNVSVAANPLRVVNTTNAAANQGIKIESDRSAPANNDSVYASFLLSDSAGNQDEFARITAQAIDVTSTSEDGRLAISVTVAGTLTDKAYFTGTEFSPSTNDAMALGSTTLMWSDVFLASGGVINWNNGDITLTHSADTLTLGGGALVANWTSAGAAVTQLVVQNSSGVANTAATIRLEPGTGSRYAEVASVNDGSNNINVVLRPSAGGTLVDALKVTNSGGSAAVTTIGNSSAAVTTINGILTVDDGSDNSTASLIFSCTGANGVNFKMIGNGAVTPNKFIRVLNGNLSVVNSGYTQEILTLTDAGNLSAIGSCTLGNAVDGTDAHSFNGACTIQRDGNGSEVHVLNLYNNQTNAGTGIILDFSPNTAGPGVRSAQIASRTMAGGNEADLLFRTAPNGGGPANALWLTIGQAVLALSPTGGLGYGTGAGGTVTQATNKGTSVTINKMTGLITMNNAALAGGASVSFDVNCSGFAATDAVILNVTGPSFGGVYEAKAEKHTAGTFAICLTNRTAGSLSEAVTIRYAIIKGVNS